MHTDEERPAPGVDLDEELIDCPPDVVLWIDAGGRVVSVHPTACERLGYSETELLGLPWSRVNPHLRDKDWARVWERTRRVEQWIWRTVYRRRDGGEFPVEVTASSMILDDRECLLAVGRDATRLLRTEERCRLLEAQILHTQKLESLGVLAGGIAHDFNNLLVGILGNASLAKMKVPPGSPSRRHLDQVELAARRAADLASQMLAYSGKGEFTVEVLDLGELIHEMAQLLRVSISKKASIELDSAAEPPLVEGDATQIRQVLMNLITNASDALGNRSGTIRISTGVVDADRRYLSESSLGDGLPEGRYAFLEVADTGCGMAEEVREKLFDPFFTTKATGRGLGMAAVVGIVHGHGGALRLESRPGEGTTFRVLLPLCEAGSKAAQRPVAGDSLGTWRGSGSILIVDDEKVIRLVARKALEQVGFHVLLANDGIEALDTYECHSREIVAVLLDIAMPRLDGIETLYELRCRRPDLRVLLSSGYNEREIVPAFTSRRFSRYLKKPYKPADLVREIRRLIEKTAPIHGVRKAISV